MSNRVGASRQARKEAEEWSREVMMAQHQLMMMMMMMAMAVMAQHQLR